MSGRNAVSDGQSRPIWRTLEAEFERRDEGWQRAIDAAGHSDDRWRLIDQRNADITKWHIIATKVARKTGVPGLVLAELTGGSRPDMPTTADEWIALLCYVRRAVDREARNDGADAYRNLYAIWRWLHIYIHVWAIPAIDMRGESTANRKAA